MTRHTTAPTYRKIIDTVFDTVPDAKLLGLTATPVRLSEKESVQLMKYYDDSIIYNVYVKDKERYGKAIIFAINAYHCISLCDLLTEKGVRCDYVYSGEKNNDHTIDKYIAVYPIVHD